jgi:hypothetical protein
MLTHSRLLADDRQTGITDYFLVADTAQRDFAKRFERGKLSFTGDVLQVASAVRNSLLLDLLGLSFLEKLLRSWMAGQRSWKTQNPSLTSAVSKALYPCSPQATAQSRNVRYETRTPVKINRERSILKLNGNTKPQNGPGVLSPS